MVPWEPYVGTLIFRGVVISHINWAFKTFHFLWLVGVYMVGIYFMLLGRSPEFHDLFSQKTVRSSVTSIHHIFPKVETSIVQVPYITWLKQNTKPYVLIYQAPKPHLMVESWKLQKFWRFGGKLLLVGAAFPGTSKRDFDFLNHQRIRPTKTSNMVTDQQPTTD